MMVNGKMMFITIMEHYLKKMFLNIKVNLNKVYLMGMEKWFGKMEIFIKEILNPI